MFKSSFFLCNCVNVFVNHKPDAGKSEVPLGVAVVDQRLSTSGKPRQALGYFRGRGVLQ